MFQRILHCLGPVSIFFAAFGLSVSFSFFPPASSLDFCFFSSLGISFTGSLDFFAVFFSSVSSDCHEWLCEGCEKAHKRVKMTKEHALLPLADAEEFLEDFLFAYGTVADAEEA